MSVYVELVLFNNIAVDAALSVALATVRRRRVHGGRILFASCLAGAWAVLYPLMPEAAQIAVRVLLCPVISLIVLGARGNGVRQKFADVIGSTLILMLLTFFTGGIVYGLSQLIGIYISATALPGLTASAVIALILSAKLIALKRHGKGICKTQFCVNSRTYSVDALMDSGNLLVDSKSGLPVIIISSALDGILDGAQDEGFIEIQTLGGRDYLPLVRLENVTVDGKTYDALGAISTKPLEGVDVILQCSMC